jgi:ketosteroid isomerase-like protein
VTAGGSHPETWPAFEAGAAPLDREYNQAQDYERQERIMTDADKDRQEIAAIVDQYRQAFTVVDMDLFMATWDKSYESIIYVPQERAQPVRGWADLEQYFKGVEGAFERVTVMEVNDLSIDVLGDAAYAFFTYHFEAHFTHENGLSAVDGRDTFILRRKNGAWKVIHYHGSPPGPY